MASTKEYLNFILEQLSALDEVCSRAMMGEYILYYRGKVFGGIYDDRLLVKPVPAAGYYRGCSIEGAESSGYYWSSTRNKPFADRALCLYFIPTFIGIGNNGFRNGGVSVRPVIK